MPALSSPGIKAIDVWNALASQLTAVGGLGMALVYASVVLAGDILLASDDTTENDGTDIYVKIKEFTAYATGTFRVKFDLRTSGIANAFGRIYKNGVAFGTEQTNNTGIMVTKSEDLDFKYLDTVELWIKSSVGELAVAENYRIYDSSGKFLVEVSP